LDRTRSWQSRFTAGNRQGGVLWSRRGLSSEKWPSRAGHIGANRAGERGGGTVRHHVGWSSFDRLEV